MAERKNFERKRKLEKARSGTSSREDHRKAAQRKAPPPASSSAQQVSPFPLGAKFVGIDLGNRNVFVSINQENYFKGKEGKYKVRQS